MEYIKKRAKKAVVSSVRLRGLIENIKKIEFHQKKATDLTECVLMQCEDLISEAKLNIDNVLEQQ